MTREAKHLLYDGPRIRKEKMIVSQMIQIYCKRKHHHEGLCEECQELNDYALKRLSHCQFGEEKPACAKCSVHCYRSDYRARIKDVMRFAGPRMLLHHPIESIKHIPIKKISIKKARNKSS